jgi:hypothetical protein
MMTADWVSAIGDEVKDRSEQQPRRSRQNLAIEAGFNLPSY